MRTARALLLLSALALPAAAEDVSLSISHSGRLLDAQDQPVNASAKAFVFRLFDRDVASSGETKFWEGSCNLRVDGGFYATTLGGGICGNQLFASYFPMDKDRFLEVSIDGVALSPRLKVSASPLALHAQNALNLGGIPASNYLLAADAQAKYAPKADYLLAADAQAKYLLQADAQATYAPKADYVTRAQADGLYAPKNLDTTVKTGPTLTGNGTTASLLNVVYGTTADTAAAGNDPRLSDARVPKGSASGDLSGTYPAPTVASIQGVAVSATRPNSGQILKYDAANARWVPADPPPTSDATKLPLTGGTLTGALTINGANTNLTLDGSLKLGANDTQACGTAQRGTLRWNDAKSAFEGCNGSVWIQLVGRAPNSQQNPGVSCRAIKADDPFAQDGAYWIDPNGGSPSDAFQIYCDMSFDGGGWTTIVNTLRPGLDNGVAVATPHADMTRKDPTLKNLALYKWPGETWSELVVECRVNATSAPARWQFVRANQPSSVQAGLNDLVLNGNPASPAFGSGGNAVCPTKNAGNVYCGHNNSGSEPTWADGFQIGNTSPTWSGLLFGATDLQGHFKCNQTTAYGYTTSSGDVGPDAIWTIRIR